MAGLVPLLACITTLAPSEAPAAPTLGLYLHRQPSLAEAKGNYTGAKFEPRYGCYLGAYIDLDSTITDTYKDQVNKIRRLPRQFEERTGRSHASYFYYMGYNSRLAFDWITRLGTEGKIVHIALEPNNGLEWVKDDEYLEALAKGFADTQTPIFLRFASEMNGPWVGYHGDPDLYIKKFRLVANAMKKHAPNVAMVWCPYTTPTTFIKEYYPGDDYVDWVGVNLYSVTYFDQDPKKPARHIHPTTKLDYVYQNYAARKPIMIGEFGATHFSALENKSVADYAQRTIQALYSALPRQYPRVKCINYFNANNLVLEHRKNNNYAVTQNPKVLDTYRSVIESPYFLSYVADENGYPQPNPYAIPVSGEAPTEAETLPLSPMPAKNGQTVSGTIRISGYIKDHSGNTNLRFKVDGRTVHLGEKKDEWLLDLDTTKLDNGPAYIEVVAEKGSKTIGTKKVNVTVKN